MDIADLRLQIAKFKSVTRDLDSCSSPPSPRLRRIFPEVLTKGNPPHEPRARATNHVFAFILPFALLMLSGCVTMQVLGEVQHGRQQLLFGNPNVALAHFQRAAEIDPDYRYNVSILSQGVWTYVGRAYYVAGKLPQARQALERARERYQDDDLAKLYLGLTLARDGDRARGLKEIAAGLGGLAAWFDYLDRYHPEARFWDPGRKTRAEIRSTLKWIEGKEFNWPELIAFGEQLGKKMEEEIDLALRQRRFEEDRDANGDDDGIAN